MRKSRRGGGVWRSMSIKSFFIGARDYRTVLQLQEKIFNAKVTRQLAISRGETLSPPLPDIVLLLEHSSPVYTLGRRDTSQGLPSHCKIDVIKTRRGGGITYHGPGQVTMYPIANLQHLWNTCQSTSKARSPIEWFSSVLEESMIQTAEQYGVPTHRFKTGVWTSCDGVAASRKLGAIGLQLGNWVSMHGASLNVNNNLEFFDEIVMCELPGRHATSLAQERISRGVGGEAPIVRQVAGVLFDRFVASLQQPSNVAVSALRDLSREAAWLDCVLAECTAEAARETHP